MMHPYDEAARIVDRFVPRHLLAVDRVAMRDAIYQAIVEANREVRHQTTEPEPQAAEEGRCQWGMDTTGGRCERFAGHTGWHIIDGRYVR